MRRFFYPRLAVQNIGKNKRFYFPYLLTCAFTVAMFYDLCFIAGHEALKSMGGGEQISIILGFGVWIVAIFSVIFLFYTNSFLIKHRKKEFGLYNILGMSKSNIGRVLLCETLITALFTLAAGVLLGVAISKLLLLILMKMMGFDAPLGFTVSGFAVIASVILFGVVFLINLLYNLGCIRLSKPVELLHGGNVGEKEPKTKWIMTVFGLICLVTAYIVALTVKSPIDALPLFFLAVILVIIGTYLLFITASITLLKALRKNKRFYYQTKHFTNISGMIYRMKQNAAGLASICILSTMVLVTVSTTVCMYNGVDNALENRFPSDISFTQKLDGKNVKTSDEIKVAVDNIAPECGRTIREEKDYTFLSFTMKRDAGTFSFPEHNYAGAPQVCNMNFLTAEQYYKLTGKNVSPDSETLYAFSKQHDFNWSTIKLDGDSYQINWLDSFPFESDLSYITDTMYLILPDDAAFEKINQKQRAAYGEDASVPQWNLMLNLDGTDEQIVDCYKKMADAVSEKRTVQTTDEQGNTVNSTVSVSHSECRQLVKDDFYGMYGGLLFIGVFFGILFLGATTLIIYYKQISEGYDDKERFDIMQKVGMTPTEVRKSINSQVLTVFFLPLAAAIIHLAFAFRMISKLLALFNLTNVTLFLICTAVTVLIFAAVYALIYWMTAKTYYRIVR